MVLLAVREQRLWDMRDSAEREAAGRDVLSGGELAELEKKTGLSAQDVERATMVFVDAEKEVLWIIVKTSNNSPRLTTLSAFP